MDAGCCSADTGWSTGTRASHSSRSPHCSWSARTVTGCGESRLSTCSPETQIGLRTVVASSSKPTSTSSPTRRPTCTWSGLTAATCAISPTMPVALATTLTSLPTRVPAGWRSHLVPRRTRHGDHVCRGSGNNAPERARPSLHWHTASRAPEGAPAPLGRGIPSTWPCAIPHPTSRPGRLCGDELATPYRVDDEPHVYLDRARSEDPRSRATTCGPSLRYPLE